ncbi:MAG: hypothetical protein K2P81_06485 [Bacteriovoracaceae bacterium]|nr:hypothetical protein [Bacteriovoracaceae bacterium]
MKTLFTILLTLSCLNSFAESFLLSQRLTDVSECKKRSEKKGLLNGLVDDKKDYVLNLKYIKTSMSSERETPDSIMHYVGSLFYANTNVKDVSIKSDRHSDDQLPGMTLEKCQEIRAKLIKQIQNESLTSDCNGTSVIGSDRSLGKDPNYMNLPTPAEIIRATTK